MNVPADLEEQVQRSSIIGRLLYVLDKVSAIGTDVMFANLPDPRALGLRGYVPVREADDQGNPLDSFLVLFFNNDSPPRIAFEVRIALTECRNSKPLRHLEMRAKALPP